MPEAIDPNTPRSLHRASGAPDADDDGAGASCAWALARVKLGASTDRRGRTDVDVVAVANGRAREGALGVGAWAQYVDEVLTLEMTRCVSIASLNH